jgi:steroid 5-alpha reductase family enzyme
MAMSGICLIVASLLMLVTWFIARALKNAGIVDVAWAFGFIILVLICATLGGGWPPRRFFIAALTLIWSGRLGVYLTRRFLRHFPQEDSRYRHLREQAGEKANQTLLFVFLWQGLIMTLLMTPAIISCANPAEGIAPVEWSGAILCLLGVIGESAADLQLAQFGRSEDNRGKVCSIGLWRYSRHPNYFFEWIVWLGFFVFALASPYGWWAGYVPLMMLHLLINVTGVKPAEEQSLKSRGEAYIQYQKETSMFIPWFRKKA